MHFLCAFSQKEFNVKAEKNVYKFKNSKQKITILNTSNMSVREKIILKRH